MNTKSISKDGRLITIIQTYPIKSITNFKENSKNQIKSIKINYKKESSPNLLADSFNNFFVAIAESIDTKLFISYKCKLQGVPGKLSNQFSL